MCKLQRGSDQSVILIVMLTGTIAALYAPSFQTRKDYSASVRETTAPPDISKTMVRPGTASGMEGFSILEERVLRIGMSCLAIGNHWDRSIKSWTSLGTVHS